MYFEKIDILSKETNRLSKVEGLLATFEWTESWLLHLNRFHNWLTLIIELDEFCENWFDLIWFSWNETVLTILIRSHYQVLLLTGSYIALIFLITMHFSSTSLDWSAKNRLQKPTPNQSSGFW